MACAANKFDLLVFTTGNLPAVWVFLGLFVSSLVRTHLPIYSNRPIAEIPREMAG